MLVSAIIANFFFTYCILLTDLLVDTLLPISSACTFFFCIFQCEKNCNIKSLAIASIYTTYITQIKNSGTFFAIVIAIYLICGKKNNYKKSRIIAAAVPFLFMAVWSVHCKLAFNNAEYSMHAFSLENFKNSILSKSFESCLDITSKMVQYSISFKDVWSLVVLIVIMGLATFFIEKNLLNQWKTLFVFSAIIYTAYQIGILAMYIFSMPLSQALGLASCERYSKASIIFLLYLCFVFASLLLYKIGDYTRPRVKVLSISLCILIISFSFFTTSGFSCFLFTSNEKDTVRRQSLEYLLDEYSIPKNKRCLIVLNQSDNWYLYYLAGYLFEPSSVSYYIPEEGNISLDSDYVVLYDDNPSMDEWVMNNYPDQLGEKVIFIE